MKHPFRIYIEAYTPLSDQDWALIERALTRKQLTRESILLEEGKICRSLYFLEEGLLRYFIWKDGQDVTKFFTQAPYCFTSQRSLSLEIPAGESIQAIEESVIWEMDRTVAFELLALKSWSTFIRKLIQEVQFNTEMLYEAIQNETAESRYKKMLKNGDPILNQAPLKYLASYLGIAPQSLSRIRKKLQVDKLKSY